MDLLRSRRGQLGRLGCWSLVQAVPALLSGSLLARALDRGFLAGDAGAGFAWLAVLGGAVVVGAWGTRQTYLRLAALVEPFRDELVALVVRGALHRATATSRPGTSTSTAELTRHVEIAREALAGVLLTVQGFAVMAAGALIGLAGLLPAAFPLVVVPLLAGLALFAATLGPMAARQRVSILADEGIAEATATVAGAMRDVTACGGERAAYAAVAGHVDAQARAAENLARFTAVRTGAVALGGWLPVALILLTGRRLVAGGASTGELLGALTYVLYGIHPALQTLVRELGGSGLWLLVTLDRVAEVTRGAGGPSGPGRVSAAGTFDLRLHGVSFRYGASPEPVLADLDLDIGEGEHLAIVGPSGVGKSTLAGLMAGLLVPDTGQVLLGGVPVSDLSTEARAAIRALVPQEAYVFAGTVGENLRYLRPGVTDEEIDVAVDRLGARGLVNRLGGYGATLEPSHLSSGERQLLTAVRTYLSPASVVILDEATCHLDPAAEAVVERAFARRPGTLVVVAHRISSALRAQRVLVLDGTRVVAGTHAEVLATSGLYRDMVGHWSAPVAGAGGATVG